MDFNPANQQLLRWYGNSYHFLNDAMLLDMIQTQVQNKYLPCWDKWNIMRQIAVMPRSHLAEYFSDCLRKRQLRNRE